MTKANLNQDCRYYAPATVDSAMELISMEGARILAGGTDLLLELKRGQIHSGVIVDISRIPELRAIRSTGGGSGSSTVIGSAVTFSQLAVSSLVKSRAAVLSQAALAIGSPQIRNRGTVGGNIANGSPAADIVPALVALESRLRLVSPGGQRMADLEEILKAPAGKTALKPGELICEIIYNTPPEGVRSAFVKLGRRESLAISRISMAAVVETDRQGVVTRAVLALGAVAPHPFRVKSAEDVLVGKKIQPQGVESLLEPVVQAISVEVARALGDRPSAAYKCRAVKGVAWDALMACLRK